MKKNKFKEKIQEIDIYLYEIYQKIKEMEHVDGVNYIDIWFIIMMVMVIFAIDWLL